jgi:hypothetical protein
MSRASGFIVADGIAKGGAPLLHGDQLIHRDSGVRLEIAQGRVYLDGEPIPVMAVDDGACGNIGAGTTVEFVNPRPGCSREAHVMPQTVGLDGGSDSFVAKSADLSVSRAIADGLARVSAQLQRLSDGIRVSVVGR